MMTRPASPRCSARSLPAAGDPGRAPRRAAPAMEPVDQAVCRLIEGAAQAHRLPVGFMTRVIWRESSFRPAVVSPAGAKGIAQFMPGTAQQRGLADPFDPEQAIPKAAGLLAELRQRFGNLGAAAAAYNAGPGAGRRLAARRGAIAARDPNLCPAGDRARRRGMGRRAAVAEQASRRRSNPVWRWRPNCAGSAAAATRR